MLITQLSIRHFVIVEQDLIAIRLLGITHIVKTNYPKNILYLDKYANHVLFH